MPTDTPRLTPTLDDLSWSPSASGRAPIAATLQQAATGGVILVDAAGLIRGWSTSAERLFGCGADDISGQPLSELAPFVARGRGETEGWCLRADGTFFRGQLVTVAAGDHGQPTTLLMVDITTRYQADEFARARRERVDRLTSSMARLVVYTIDIERGEVEASDGFSEVIGWTQGAPPRQLNDLLQLVPPDDRAGLVRRLEHAVVTRGSFAHEFRIFAHAGERWLHVVGTFVDDHHPRIVGTGMDVTARRHADDALRASEAKLQAVLDSTIDAIVAIGDDGCIASVNRTATTMFGRPAHALVGRPWRSLLEVPPPTALPGDGVLEELMGRRADGASFPMECGFTHIDDSGRRLVIAVVRDVTERRRMDRQLLDVSEQLQRQIGQDLHDGLGQLLTGTAFLAKGLQQHVGDEYQPQAQRVVELINQAINRVRSLARGLSPIHVETQSLEAVLRHVVAESSKLLGVECVLELRDPVEADQPATIAQLCLIAREAITNAVRHGQARRIVVTLARVAGRPTLAIADDGIGISASAQTLEGLGLRSMRHRARVIGGALEVGRAKVGTVVRCFWNE